MTNSLDRKIERAAARAAARAAEERAEAERFSRPWDGLTNPNTEKGDPSAPATPAAAPAQQRVDPAGCLKQDAEAKPPEENDPLYPPIKVSIGAAASLEALRRQMDGAMLMVDRAAGIRPPPIGFMPATLFYTQRRETVRNAIQEFAMAGHKIPEAWLAEIAELESLEIPLQPPGHSPTDAQVGLDLLKRSMQHDPEYARTWFDNLASVVMGSLAHVKTEDGTMRFSVRHDVGKEAARRFMALAFDIKDIDSFPTPPPADRAEPNKATLSVRDGKAVLVSLSINGVQNGPTVIKHVVDEGVNRVVDINRPPAEAVPMTIGLVKPRFTVTGEQLTREQAVAEIRSLTSGAAYLTPPEWDRLHVICALHRGITIWVQTPPPAYALAIGPQVFRANTPDNRPTWVVVAPEAG